MDWVGRVIDGRYVVESVIGSGGMGVVLAARHKFTGQRVAVKMVRKDLGLDAEIEGRFLAEARVPAAIGHRGVVQTIDAGKTPEGELYLAMELLIGRSLRVEMQHGPLALAAVRRIGMELLDVLSAAHSRGVIHRDVKPENVFLVAPDQSVKLLDFGITKLLTSAHSVLPRTQAGVVLGTVAYMAPEQLADARAVDARADLWAVGVMLYEMISGRRPYRGNTVEDLLRALVQQEPDPIRVALPTATPDLEAFFSRALARDPARRFATAAEMAQAFAQLTYLPRPSSPTAGVAAVTPPAGTGPVTPPAGMLPVTPPPGMAFTPPSGVSPVGPTMASLHPNAAIRTPTAQVPSAGSATDQIPRSKGGGSAWLVAVAAAGVAVAGTALFFHFRKTEPTAPSPAPAPAPAPVPAPAPAPVPAPVTAPVAAPQPPQPAAHTPGKPTPHTGSTGSTGSTQTGGPAPVDPYAGGSAAAPPPQQPDFCSTACKTLTSCRLVPHTCEAECSRGGPNQKCIVDSGGDCNRFAGCWFSGYCSQLPIGTHSCAEAMTCDAPCNGNQVCVCNCLQGLAPAHAAAYLALRRCVDSCSGNMQCIAKNCDSQLRRCRAE